MRRKKFVLNTVTALLKQITFVVCGFVLPRYILLYYGSAVNGLITSITQFLGFISFLEMGIGPVIQSNLYKYLVTKDNCEISKIVVSAERFFRKIATIFVVYIIVLIFVFPVFINSSFTFAFTGSLIMIIAISTFAQYYFGITYQLLLNADQRGYIQIIYQMITILLNTIVSVILMKIGFSIHIVRLVTALIYLIRPIGQMLYVHRHYHLEKKIQFTGEPIQQKWNGFAQHLAAVVVQNTDVTVLTLVSSLQNVSIYSIYFNVVYGIGNTVITMLTGLEALWGNMLAKGEKKRVEETFEIAEWAIHAGVTLLFTVTGILIVPFVKVYTLGIKDANYIAPVFSAILVMSYGIQCLRVPYFKIIKAAGHYKETQNGSFIQMIINVVLSLLLVFKYELNGVAVGTFVAMFYHTVYFVVYLSENIINRPLKYFWKHIFVDVLSVFISSALTHNLFLQELNYMTWIMLAVEVFLTCLLTTGIINVIFYRLYIRKILKYCKREKVHE